MLLEDVHVFVFDGIVRPRFDMVWLWSGDVFVHCSNQVLSSRLPSHLLVKYAALAFGNDRSQTKPVQAVKRQGKAWPGPG
jgi:hypothetical protein